MLPGLMSFQIRIKEDYDFQVRYPTFLYLKYCMIYLAKNLRKLAKGAKTYFSECKTIAIPLHDLFL